MRTPACRRACRGLGTEEDQMDNLLWGPKKVMWSTQHLSQIKHGEEKWPNLSPYFRVFLHLWKLLWNQDLGLKVPEITKKFSLKPLGEILFNTVLHGLRLPLLLCVFLRISESVAAESHLSTPITAALTRWNDSFPVALCLVRRSGYSHQKWENNKKSIKAVAQQILIIRGLKKEQNDPNMLVLVSSGLNTDINFEGDVK